MFAVVSIAGFQEIVEKGMKLKVPTLPSKVGESVSFEKVLLTSSDDKITVGKPFVPGVKVTVVVKAHGKTDKILVQKFKRRKRYFKTLRGHRQGYTEVEVVSVG